MSRESVEDDRERVGGNETSEILRGKHRDIVVVADGVGDLAENDEPGEHPMDRKTWACDLKFTDPLKRFSRVARSKFSQKTRPQCPGLNGIPNCLCDNTSNDGGTGAKPESALTNSMMSRRRKSALKKCVSFVSIEVGTY
jgi:hypothetical protein